MKKIVYIIAIIIAFIINLLLYLIEYSGELSLKDSSVLKLKLQNIQEYDFELLKILKNEKQYYLIGIDKNEDVNLYLQDRKSLTIKQIAKISEISLFHNIFYNNNSNSNISSYNLTNKKFLKINTINKNNTFEYKKQLKHAYKGVMIDSNKIFIRTIDTIGRELFIYYDFKNNLKQNIYINYKEKLIDGGLTYDGDFTNIEDGIFYYFHYYDNKIIKFQLLDNNITYKVMTFNSIKSNKENELKVVNNFGYFSFKKQPITLNTNCLLSGGKLYIQNSTNSNINSKSITQVLDPISTSLINTLIFPTKGVLMDIQDSLFLIVDKNKIKFCK